MRYLVGRYDVSTRRACGVIRTTRSSVYYRSRKDPLTALRQRHARAGADARAIRLSPACGCCCSAKAGRSAKSASIASTPRKAWRCGASGRGGTRRRCIASSGGRRRRATTSGAWISSPTQLADGRRFRALTVIDLFTRECLAIDVGQGLGGQDVAATLERLRFERGLPQRIYCDNGTEFVSAAMDLLGLYQRRDPRLQPPRQADRQRHDRILQRTVPRRVFERALVRVAGGRAAEDRRVSVGLQ